MKRSPVRADPVYPLGPDFENLSAESSTRSPLTPTDPGKMTVDETSTLTATSFRLLKRLAQPAVRVLNPDHSRSGARFRPEDELGRPGSLSWARQSSLDDLPRSHGVTSRLSPGHSFNSRQPPLSQSVSRIATRIGAHDRGIGFGE